MLGDMYCTKWIPIWVLVYSYVPQGSNQVFSLTIYGRIENDTEFYHKELSEYPSKLATIEYCITYNYTAVLIYNASSVGMDIYTTKYDRNLHKRCLKGFGQLRNENLHIPLSLRKRSLLNLQHRFPNCSMDLKDSDIIHCHGKTTIQDYIPRHYGFSFGSCEQLVRGSLKGLRYNISIYNQNNETNCSSINPVRDVRGIEHCGLLYSHMSLPNLIGDPNWNHVLTWINVLKELEVIGILLMTNNSFRKWYKILNQVMCYVIVPKCDPINNQVIHPCKEMCTNMKDGWMAKTFLQESLLKESVLPALRAVEIRNTSKWFDCDYLPSKHGSIPCFYESLTCDAAPNVENAIMDDRLNFNKIYKAKAQVEYSCANDQFQMKGNSTITCLHNGEWSVHPKCVKIVGNKTPLMILLPVLIIPIVLYLVIVITLRCRQKTKSKNLTRNKTFDAFVCYAFDADNEFVMTSIQPELEKEPDQSFKLCIHSRDFDVGLHIFDNIQEAIENSNSAIIVMSQGFVLSHWCKEEFTHCYIEHIKDPAFRLFVIMMQPQNTLVNLSKCIRKFIDQKTYLKKDDPDLIEKIVKYLRWIKQPKDETKHEDEVNEPEEAERFIE